MTARTYYTVEFEYPNQRIYALWYSSDHEDGFLMDGNHVRVFPKAFDAVKFAQENGLDLEMEAPAVILCNAEKLLAFDDMDCAAVLDFWNIASDMARSCGCPFFGDAKEAVTTCIYHKLFRGCNLPSMTDGGERFYPKWSDAEKDTLIRVIQSGLTLLNNSLAIM